MIEAEKTVAGSGLSGSFGGSEGLFAAVESRGLVYNNKTLETLYLQVVFKNLITSYKN